MLEQECSFATKMHEAHTGAPRDGFTTPAPGFSCLLTQTLGGSRAVWSSWVPVTYVGGPVYVPSPWLWSWPSPSISGLIWGRDQWMGALFVWLFLLLIFLSEFCCRRMLWQVKFIVVLLSPRSVLRSTWSGDMSISSFRYAYVYLLHFKAMLLIIYGRWTASTLCIKSVLCSCSYCDKLTKPWWLKATEICSFLFMKARDPQYH